jgi:hypothetical protein
MGRITSFQTSASCNINIDTLLTTLLQQQTFSNLNSSATSVTIKICKSYPPTTTFLRPRPPPPSSLNHLIIVVQLHLDVEISSKLTKLCLLYREPHPQGPIQTLSGSAPSHPCHLAAHPDSLLGSSGFSTIELDESGPRSQHPSTTRSSCISG